LIYLLDTDRLEHFQREHANVVRRVSIVGAENIAITIITRIEVLRARFEYLLKAANSDQLAKAQYWLAESDRLLAEWEIVPFNDVACREFEHLRTTKGLRKIGRADLLIACIALASGATLASRNIRDFKVIPGLRVENWID
jgi:tRNA(fMet)-specific endonuclease VapC